MTRGPQTCLLLIIIALASGLAALKLPYEVLDSIVEVSYLNDFKDLMRVNVSDDRGPTRPIYRLDLDPDYVAYYEIDTGRNYVVFSAGHKTGDFREVQSGPDPRPTNVLIEQAQKNGQHCEKFYRLSPMGLTICKNDNGTVVAASYNWTADIAEVEDWRQLDRMVNQNLNEFKKQWRERALSRQTKLEWASTVVVSEGEKKKKGTDEEAISPGSIVRVALGEHFKSVHVYVTSYGDASLDLWRSDWQQKLCKVLVDVCLLEGKPMVNPSAIQKTPNNLFYLKLEVHSNEKFVRTVLQQLEIGFVVEIKGHKNEVVKKHFAINLHSKRFKRSSGGGIPCRESSCSEENFPDYNQHICCGGCYSGCGPVAWAQVFGYYDRRAASPNSIFSSTIYGDSRTKAPLSLTNDVKSFVESIRSWVRTYCDDDQGTTETSKMHLIAPWFRARQGSKARVVSYLQSRKRRSTGGAIAGRGSRSWIESKGVRWLDSGYPVIFGFLTERKAGHFAVATKYQKTSRSYRHCEKKTTRLLLLSLLLFGKKTKPVCFWKTAYDYKFFLHYGWGGYNNNWQPLSPFSAHVAYITK